MELNLPPDAVTGSQVGVDLLADYLELAAFLADDAVVRTADIQQPLALDADGDADLNRELAGETDGVVAEGVVVDAVERIRGRRDALEAAYPFTLAEQGDILICELDENSLGHVAYVLCLVLSNLESVSPVLVGSGACPADDEVRRLREYFQYFATAALAAEVGGDAWSFGFPRPGGSGFLSKLTEIWAVLGDGRVEPQRGAPAQPKDDQVDVFAARPHRDGLPGFLFAAAQVATGKDARKKSLKAHLDAFRHRWFAAQPVTAIVPYMIVPFATDNEQFVDDVRVMGNVLHRLRVPCRVAEAGQLMHNAGARIEGYDRLAEAAQWVADYRKHAGAAA